MARNIELKIAGMHCLDCARKVEKALQGVPGVDRAEVQYIRKWARVVAEDEVDVKDLVAAVQAAGYGAEPAQ